MASRGCGANRTAGGSVPDRQAFMAWRGQSLPLPVSHWRKGSVGPQLESATVERRKGSRSHREGPRLTSAGVAPRTRDRRKKSAPVGAPSTPHRGTELLVSRRWRQSPMGSPADVKARHLRRDGQPGRSKRAAGANNTALFDIVNTTTANGSRVSRDVARVVRAPLS